MDQLISLDRADNRFLSHLEGTFSTSHRAIPTKSLNVNSKKEYVTFKIVPVQNVKRPRTILLWWETLRLSSICLSLGPVLSALVLLNVTGVAVIEYLAVLSFVSVFLLHASMNLLNDYYDHLKGVDRLESIHAIQKGWMRAIDLYNWGVSLLLMGLLIGLVVIYKAPGSLLPVIFLAAVGVLKFSSNRMGLKYLGLGELTIFLLAGPLLVLGYAIAVSSPIKNEIIILGVFSGLLATFTIHINNMREVMNNCQAGIKNLVTLFGYDRAKPIACLILLGIALSWWMILFQIDKGPTSFVFWLLGVLLIKWVYFKIIWAKSNVSSHLNELLTNRYRIHFSITLLFALSVIF
ncbi:MAG: prenyltransferase [Pseudomonadota bacterium]|nr:prenyltransferase [Pseudomonadota bacterium]